MPAAGGGGGGVVVGKGDEAEAAGVAGVAISHDDAVEDGADLFEVAPKRVLVGVPGEAADEDFGAEVWVGGLLVALLQELVLCKGIGIRLLMGVLWLVRGIGLGWPLLSGWISFSWWITIDIGWM